MRPAGRVLVPEEQPVAGEADIEHAPGHAGDPEPGGDQVGPAVVGVVGGLRPEGDRVADVDREGVVVLPFTPMAPGEDAQRMAEGMAYELATELGRNVDLRVVSPLASAGNQRCFCSSFALATR